MRADSDQENVKDVRNPISRAEKEKELSTIGVKKDIITNPQQLYESVLKYDKTFKSVKNTHPLQKDISIVDFSLNARGPVQDQVYAKHPFYRNNIRRGNTLLCNQKQKRVIWGRKGLIKFFDVSQSSLKAIVNENVKDLWNKDQRVHYAVFEEIENVLSCNDPDELKNHDFAKVHVYRLNKANGENAQISYCAELGEWVISSKNVSVLLKDKAGLKTYNGQRYAFAALIAEAWFAIMEKKDKKQVQLLKEDLAGRTIVGEYCGNPDFQHLVKYADTTIYFYAMVTNISTQSCEPPNEAFKFLEKHQLPIVKNHEKSYYGKFVNFVELGKGLEKLFKEVATASIFEEEEGSVLYFVLQKPKKYCEYISDRFLQKTVSIPDNWDKTETHWKVSSLGKLKTLEYRILRKLRQKLRSYTRVKKGAADQPAKEFKKFQEKYGAFEKETYKLLRGAQLNKPIQYYFCVALLAFEYVFNNRKSPKALEALSERYLDFISVVFWCVENKKPVNKDVMSDLQLQVELRDKTWEKYSIEIVKDYEPMLQKIVPKYAKIKKTIDITNYGSENEDKDQKEEKEQN